MRILIVGGGSAGWITATYLDHTLNPQGRRNVDICLVESESIGRIGVGEATIPTLRNTLVRMGISEHELFENADATFKQAIRFDNWYEQGHSYYHPFDRVQLPYGDELGLQWLMSDQSTPFSHVVSSQPAFCDAGVAPKKLSSPPFGGTHNYAYHMDAEKFAQYLCSVATSRGVEHMLRNITGIELANPETISCVVTDQGEKLTADLFIDCTGFARLLIGKALKVEYESYGQWLLCDRALAMRVPYDAKKPDNIRPFTTSTALSAGWVWDIGLRDRRGVGYVYSSQFISDEEAEAELRAYEGSHADDITPRKLPFRSGRTAKPWHGNCVAIGLSAGFLEPLESTGLYFVEVGAKYLRELLPRFGSAKNVVALYNEQMRKRYEESLDFINLHYCLTRRDDTAFWREVQKPERIPERLRQKLALWQEKPPSTLDFTETLQLFSHINFEYILYGMNWRPDLIRDRKSTVKPPRPEAVVQSEEKQLPEMLSHDAFLAAFSPRA